MAKSGQMSTAEQTENVKKRNRSQVITDKYEKRCVTSGRSNLLQTTRTVPHYDEQTSGFLRVTLLSAVKLGDRVSVHGRIGDTARSTAKNGLRVFTRTRSICDRGESREPSDRLSFSFDFDIRIGVARLVGFSHCACL